MNAIRQAIADREKSRQQKAHSRRNLLKETLKGHGIVLPDELDEQIQAQITIWSQGFKGWDERDLAMIEQAAVEHLRVVDCQRQETELRIKQCFRAHTHWDRDKRKEAKDLFNKLHRNPLVHACRLESTLRGCELMINRWEELLSLLESDKPWNEIHRGHALDLLGVAKDIRDARMKIDARPGQSVVAVQKKVCESEITRLKGFRDSLIEEDDEAREATMAGLGVIDPATQAIRRYEASCKRSLQVALRWIENSRKRGQKPAQMPKHVTDANDLRDYTLRQEKIVKLDPSVASKLVSVEPIYPITSFGVATPAQAIELPLIKPADQSIVSVLRKEVRPEKEVDDWARRAKRPDPAKIRAKMKENLAKQADCSKKKS